MGTGQFRNIESHAGWLKNRSPYDQSLDQPRLLRCITGQSPDEWVCRILAAIHRRQGGRDAYTRTHVECSRGMWRYGERYLQINAKAQPETPVDHWLVTRKSVIISLGMPYKGMADAFSKARKCHLAHLGRVVTMWAIKSERPYGGPGQTAFTPLPAEIAWPIPGGRRDS
jgi:hypothetical protein